MGEKATAVGRLIYDLRVEKDIQQGELAHAISIHQSVLNRIEKGTRPIRDTELRDIALYLNVSADYLLGIASAANNTYDKHDKGYKENSNNKAIVPTQQEADFIFKLRRLDSRGFHTVMDNLNREFSYSTQSSISQ